MGTTRSLHELARLYGVQTAQEDAEYKLKSVRPEAVLAVLRALDAAVRTFEDIPGAIRFRRQEVWRTLIEPVTVAWHGTRAAVQLRIQASQVHKRIRWDLECEDGLCQVHSERLDTLPTVHQRTVEGVPYLLKRLVLPAGLPSGYHRLRVDFGRVSAQGLVIAAPLRACGQEVIREPAWGLFLPLYALRRQSSWGSGDLGDQDELMRWMAAQGGKAVGMLPMLATLWELGEGPSPYEPTSRLFWNEFYLDVNRLANLPQCASARHIMAQARFQANLQAMRQARLVDYAGQLAAKRRVVSVLAQSYFAGSDRSGLDGYVRRQPLSELFARFRAVGERRGVHWNRWPERMRRGEIRPGDYAQRDYRYYLYSQWQMREQVAQLADAARTAGADIYMDLPLGVRGDGFDAWLEQDLFVHGMSVGAPPDAFAQAGQNWQFPPVHPQKQRQAGYRYFLSCLRGHLEFSRILRLDHVMGLYRLYWIPEGMEAVDGMYVRYPRDEMLAILTLESHRHRAMIVGENLGTVPEAVNQAMRRRRIHSMYVVPFEVAPSRPAGLKPVPLDCVASMNTHDLPAWAAYWDDLDIDERVHLGLLSPGQARAMRRDRTVTRRVLVAGLRRRGLLGKTRPPAGEVLQACLTLMGASAARLVMVNLEDAWSELHGQNLPGAPRSYPNWRRKARYSLEEFSRMPQIASLLKVLDQARRRR